MVEYLFVEQRCVGSNPISNPFVNNYKKSYDSLCYSFKIISWKVY